MSRDRNSGAERRSKRAGTTADAAAAAATGTNGKSAGGDAAPDAPFADREVPLPASFDPPAVERGNLARLLAGQHHDPHSILGAHPASVNGADGAVVEATFAPGLGAPP